MPLALGIMMGLYIWAALRRTRAGSLPGEAGRIDRLLRFLQLGLVVVSAITVAIMIWASGVHDAETQGYGGLRHVLVVTGTIFSYGLTVAAAVACLMYYRSAKRSMQDRDNASPLR